MVRTATPAFPSDEGPTRYGLRSDGRSSVHGYLGDFARGPALFTVYSIPADQGRYPNEPGYYLIDVDDGVGPRECGRFTVEPKADPGSGPGSASKVEAEWNGAWNNDPWCTWILERARALIPGPKRT